MSTKLNITQLPGYDWTYKASASDNRVRSTVTYSDDRDNWQSRMPLIGSVHPEIAGLYLVDVEAKGAPGGLVDVVLHYESSSAEASYPGRPAGVVKRYDIEIVTSEEHILTHPRYGSLSAAEREALMAIANGNFEDGAGNSYEKLIESDLGKEALGKIQQGKTHYLEPGIVWVERFNTSSLSDLNIGKAGNIDSPPGGAPTGGGRNYLYIGATGTMTEDGRSFEAQKRWQLSGRGGWDPEFYND